LTKEPKTHIGEKTSSSANGARKMDYLQVVETRSLYLTLCKKSTQNGSKILISDLKLLQENTLEILEDKSIYNYFLNRTPIAQVIRARIDKWN
jgi:hypothetical protein